MQQSYKFWNLPTYCILSFLHVNLVFPLPFLPLVQHANLYLMLILIMWEGDRLYVCVHMMAPLSDKSQGVLLEYKQHENNKNQYMYPANKPMCVQVGGIF